MVVIDLEWNWSDYCFSDHPEKVVKSFFRGQSASVYPKDGRVKRPIEKYSNQSNLWGKLKFGLDFVFESILCFSHFIFIRCGAGHVYFESPRSGQGLTTTKHGRRGLCRMEIQRREN